MFLQNTLETLVTRTGFEARFREILVHISTSQITKTAYPNTA